VLEKGLEPEGVDVEQIVLAARLSADYLLSRWKTK